jgi:hypothetical protein
VVALGEDPLLVHQLSALDPALPRHVRHLLHPVPLHRPGEGEAPTEERQRANLRKRSRVDESTSLNNDRTQFTVEAPSHTLSLSASLGEDQCLARTIAINKQSKLAHFLFVDPIPAYHTLIFCNSLSECPLLQLLCEVIRR